MVWCAGTLFRRAHEIALEIRRKLFGDDHDSTKSIHVYKDIPLLHVHTPTQIQTNPHEYKMYFETIAGTLFRRALEIRRKLFGDDHDSTTTAVQWVERWKSKGGAGSRAGSAVSRSESRGVSSLSLSYTHKHTHSYTHSLTLTLSLSLTHRPRSETQGLRAWSCWSYRAGSAASRSENLTSY